MSNTQESTHQRKAMLTQVCDAENYLPIITACLDEAQVKKLKPRHMANFMALSAELFISNYAMIADAFERNNGLEIGFKAKLAQEKDNVEIQFKPVDVFKDSASANLPDEDQEEFPFVKKPSAAAAATKAPVVDAEVLALPAPATVLGLPFPIDGDEEEIPYQEKPKQRTPDEEAAYQEGRAEFDPDSVVYDFNPYDEADEAGLPLHEAYRDGWNDKRMERMHQECVTSILEATKGKIEAVLERIERACVTAEEYIGILIKADGSEAAGKNREWLGLKISKAITEAFRKRGY